MQNRTWSDSLKIEVGCGCNKLIVIYHVEIEFDPILVVCFEGLLETEHPYNFASKQSIKELLQSEVNITYIQGAKDKVVPILSKLINPLRLALASNVNDTFGNALEILEIVSINVNYPSSFPIWSRKISTSMSISSCNKSTKSHLICKDNNL